MKPKMLKPVNATIRMLEDGSAVTTAELFLYDMIHPWFISANFVRSEIARVRGNVDRLLVRINSIGGDVMEATAIMSVLRTSELLVDTRIDGGAFSAAGYIAQAGAERSIVEGGAFHMHRPMAFTEGNADELEAIATELRELESSIAAVYAARSGRSVEDIDDLMRGESGADGTFMNAESTIKQGFADILAPLVDGQSLAIPEPPAEMLKTRMGVVMRGAPAALRELFAATVQIPPPGGTQAQALAKNELARMLAAR